MISNYAMYSKVWGSYCKFFLSPKSIFALPLPSSMNKKKLTGFVAPATIRSHSFQLLAEAHFVPEGVKTRG